MQGHAWKEVRMVFRLLRGVVRCAVLFEFHEAWLSLLLLWIHIRYRHEIVTVESQGEDEANDHGGNEADGQA